MPQLQMEVVDIWHFILSDLIIKCNGDHAVAVHLLIRMTAPVLSFECYIHGVTYVSTQLDTVRKIELLIAFAALRENNGAHINLFSSIMTDCGMGWDDLYRQYVSKNVLNFFRQDNGYKTGEYQKIWDGREDNEHLVEILAALDSQAPNFSDELYGRLNAQYQISLQK